MKSKTRPTRRLHLLAASPPPPPAHQNRRQARGFRTHRGFTLTELLVTITIMAVLAALAFLMTDRIRQKTMEANCVTKLRQLALAGQSYASDKGHYPTHAAQPDGSSGNWIREIAPYLGIEDSTDPDEIQKNVSFPSCEAALKAAPPGTGTDPMHHARTYSMNEMLRAARGNNPTTFPPTLTSEVRDLSRSVFFTDSAHTDGTRTWPQMTIVANWIPNPKNFLHQGKANIVFLDGHVESKRANEIPKDRQKDQFWNPKVSR